MNNLIEATNQRKYKNQSKAGPHGGGSEGQF